MLDGGAGYNKLIATITGDVTPASLANIQDVQVTNAGAALSTVTLTNAGQVEKLSTSGNTSAISFNNVQNRLSELNISNNSVAVTVQTAAAAVAGAEDVLNVNLASVTAGALSATVTGAGTNGYETIAINSGGSVANTLASVAATGANTLNVSGSQNLTITAALANSVTTINASEMTGALNVTVGNLVTAGHTVTGGKGNDVFDLTAGYTGGAATVQNRDIIDGGEGRDTLALTGAQLSAVTTAQANVSNIEIIRVASGLTNGQNVNTTHFTGVDTLELGTGGGANSLAGTQTITLATGSTVILRNDTAAGSTTAFVVGGTGTADALTLQTNGFDFAGAGAETFNGVEVLNINTGATATDATVFANALTMTATAGGSTKIVATGANGLTLSGTVTANELDASGLTGTAALDMTGGGLAGAGKVVGTDRADTIIGSAGNDVLVAGAGNDSITGGAGNDVIDITGGGSNTMVFASTGALNGSDTIQGFNVGAVASGGDVLNVNAFNAVGTAAIVTASAAAQATIAGAQVIRISDNAAADFSNVLAVMNAAIDTSGAVTANTVILLDNGTDTNVYYYVDDGNAAAIEAGEISLVGTLTGVADATGLIAANFVL